MKNNVKILPRIISLLTALFLIILFVLPVANSKHLNKTLKISAAEDPLPMHIEDDEFYRIEGTLQKEEAAFEEAVKDGSPSLEVFVHSTITNIQHSTLSNLIGPPGAAESEEAATGAIPALTGLIAEMYTIRPVSTKLYLADVMQSAKIIDSAQAQGIGFTALDPILAVWKTFRNLAYFFFVIIFIVIGFMIMFRHKISGQTVVTVEQAIPSVLVALLFVTFSYAIAGLLIDFMYLAMYLIIGLFEGSREVMNYSIFQLGVDIIKQGAFEGGVSNSIQQIVRAAGLPGVFEFFTSITIKVILGIALLFAIFKLFFVLIKSYILIILNVAFAPLFLMLGAIPGKNTFNRWFTDLVGHLAAFPTVLLMLLIQKIISEGSLAAGRGGFMPPFLLGHGIGGALPAMVGVGMLLAMPEAVKKVKEAIGVTEGVFAELAGVAGERFGQQASQFGAPALAAQTGIAGGALGAGYGALRGLGRDESLESYWRRVKKDAKRGAQTGFKAPLYARRVYPTAKKELEKGWKDIDKDIVTRITEFPSKAVPDKARTETDASERVANDQIEEATKKEGEGAGENDFGV